MISKLNINIVTPFPKMFDVMTNESILLKSHQKNIVDYNIYNLFDFLSNSKDRIDDYPFGGGEGMILKPEPIFNAVENINKKLKIFNIFCTFSRFFHFCNTGIFNGNRVPEGK